MHYVENTDTRESYGGLLEGVGPLPSELSPAAIGWVALARLFTLRRRG